MPVIPGYLSTDEVAKILEVTPARVRQLAEKLGGIKTPGLLYPEKLVRTFAKVDRRPGNPGKKDSR